VIPFFLLGMGIALAGCAHIVLIHMFAQRDRKLFQPPPLRVPAGALSLFRGTVIEAPKTRYERIER
jgi:hypothetical protein